MTSGDRDEAIVARGDEITQIGCEDPPLDDATENPERRREGEVVDHEATVGVRGEPVFVPQPAEGAGDRLVDEHVRRIEGDDTRHEGEGHPEVPASPRDVLATGDQPARSTPDDRLAGRAHRLEVEPDVAREIEGGRRRNGEHRLQPDPGAHPSARRHVDVTTQLTR